MNIDVATERILVLKDQIQSDEANGLAWEKKTSAFDTFSKVASFLSRPKDDDFELIYSEHRYEPFWHVIAKAHYVYDRNATYQVVLSSPVVRTVTLHETDYQATNNHIHIPVVEHCVQEEYEEVHIDGVSGKNVPSLAAYRNRVSNVVEGKIEELVPKNSILVPPQSKISGIMRDSLAKMIKGIQADKILEEQVEVSTIDLYYRPVYAYQFHWKSKNKDGILQIDAVTGTITSDSKIFREYLGKVLDQDFLFDIGADAAGMIIPGGSIAVKAARKYMNHKS
jgi:hypothetical protein